MLSVISYFLALVTAVVVMVWTDDDPTTVSMVEWVLFAVMLFAAYELCKRLIRALKRGDWD